MYVGLRHLWGLYVVALQCKKGYDTLGVYMLLHFMPGGLRRL